MTNNNTTKGTKMTTYTEPKIVYSEEKYGQRLARLSNGGMCIVERTYKPEKKSWKWEAVKCEPNVFEMEDLDTGEVKSYAISYKQVEGWEGQKTYGKTRKEAVLDCLYQYWG